VVFLFTKSFFSFKVLDISVNNIKKDIISLFVREDFTYSQQDRLLTHTHKIGTGIRQLLAANE
jgi:hypothetical protein